MARRAMATCPSPVKSSTWKWVTGSAYGMRGVQFSTSRVVTGAQDLARAGRPQQTEAVVA